MSQHINRNTVTFGEQSAMAFNAMGDAEYRMELKKPIARYGKRLQEAGDEHRRSLAKPKFIGVKKASYKARRAIRGKAE